MTNVELQIKLFKEYGVTNYTIDGDKITINDGLYLSSLTTVHKDFLSNSTINGNLDLYSLTTAHKDFLSNTTINGRLELNSLNSEDQIILDNNVKQLTEGYFPDKGYCYFDGILRKVLSVTKKKDYTIYTTPFDYIAQKGNFTAHGKTIKKAILDLEFKIVREKLSNEPINGNTIMSVKHYRIITGACELGCKDFMNKNGISYRYTDDELEVVDDIRASELLVMLEKNNAYGLEKFRELVTN